MDAAAGLLAGTGWASGVNLYLAVLLLGLAGRADWFDAPSVVENPAVLVVAGALFLTEFVVDKIPYADNAWDAVHTLVRPLGAAFLGAALAGDAETLVQGGAAAASGGLALASHTAKATARLAINASPEPATNILASLAEDSVVLTVLFFAINNPQLALVLVVVLLLAGTALAVGLFKAAKAARRKLRERRRGRISRISGRPY